MSLRNEQQEEPQQQNGGQQQIIPIDAISLQSLGSFLLFGEIDEMSSYRAIDFIIKSNMILDSSIPLTMFVNSPGGSCSDGFAIIDVMKTSRLKIQTVSTGSIASMGVLIAAAGSKGMRIMTKNTEVMAHQFSGYLFGKRHELVAAQTYHDRLEQQFIKFFLNNTKMNEKQVKDILFSPSDRWLTPQECVKYGIVDTISEYLVPETDIATSAKAPSKKTSSKATKVEPTTP